MRQPELCGLCAGQHRETDCRRVEYLEVEARTVERHFDDVRYRLQLIGAVLLAYEVYFDDDDESFTREGEAA